MYYTILFYQTIFVLLARIISFPLTSLLIMIWNIFVWIFFRHFLIFDLSFHFAICSELFSNFTIYKINFLDDADAEEKKEEFLPTCPFLPIVKAEQCDQILK